MDIADERGLNAEGLKEVTSDVAGAFGDAFKGDEIEAEANLPAAARATDNRHLVRHRSRSASPAPQHPTRRSSPERRNSLSGLYRYIVMRKP